ncbi:hypothetical protein AKJ37_03120 [candidate division MSBL1 archaeon SCGC-AAA259I09]|uniref:UPF0237 protein AKJ38_01700 n=3 Tax=candidate division MSBL1 TaxID=215777 RepID=A0A133USX0_9EURY|nr:hypothetical protein AKJ38_01700 [candidate division MSBL1 archaeon SCGC-AAA259I14]KXA97383.1 hypothetical protein AKJ37_03120 [candidate division MSBL1 archaeon SCGC-AAA259I09]KXA97871.1 hypothetical protein AKJ39_02935 [candidate division MSBL1 archaeon SCGC-AAA259J03]
MAKELCFVTVIGEDQKGIIAKMATSVYEKGINIEDISQKVIEGYFVMSMLIDIKDSNYSLKQIEEDLQEIGKEMGLQVQLQHEEIFKSMHRV